MTFNLLISCMHEKDTSIIARSNVQSDVVVVNQCDCDSVEEFDFTNKKGRTCHAKFINSTSRGLSISRNIALNNAWGDICQICDDDQIMANDGEEIIIKRYQENPNAGLIAFSLNREDTGKKYPQKRMKLGLKQILKTCSVQITFNLKRLKEYGIKFDEKMGSGTGNGGGEENRFMLDWRKNKAEMLYFPDVIATVLPGDSQWFKGYDAKNFYNLGWSSRRLFGATLGLIYIIYWSICRRSYYKTKGNLPMSVALRSSIKGYFSKR